MRAPKWLRRNVVTIFICVLVLTLMVGSVIETLAASDGFSDEEVLYMLLGALVVLLVVLARVRSDNGQPESGPQPESVGDMPTGQVLRPATAAVVMPFPARRRFRGSATYHTGEVPAAIPMQSRRLAEPDTDPRMMLESLPPVRDADEVLRTALREDTGGHPPVWGGREEAK